jgi:hypothetical protein
MPSVGRHTSVILSKILSFVIFAALIAALFLIPAITTRFLGKDETILKTAAFLLLYASVPPAFAADLYLHFLLRNIEKDNVFISANVRYLRIISWCCFFVGVIYTVGGFYFNTAFVISFAAFFIFMILRVIKKCICSRMRPKGRPRLHHITPNIMPQKG